MNLPEAAIVLLFLFLGPVVLAPLERNLEWHFFALGIISATLAGLWEWDLVRRTLLTPLPITVAVVIAGAIFARVRAWLDRRFEKIRGRVSRGPLTSSVVLVISLASCVVTAIIAALMLVEAVGLLRLGPAARTRVVIAGCFAIGLGSALTPIGGPLATLAASAMDLDFLGLFSLLAPWALPAVVVSSFIAGYYARGSYDLIAEEFAATERMSDAMIQGIKIFAFIAGLVLISAAFAPIASRYVATLSNNAMFWGNTLSAVLDNSTLVALEFHRIDAPRARSALLSLLISGGMLIPGNIPNIVCASRIEIGSGEWARVGVPLGLAGLIVYFAALNFVD